MKDIGTHTRIYGLDILRAIAIIAVMLSHGYDYSAHLLSIGYYGWLVPDGVSVFFVLSGFLIGGILIRTIREKDFTFRELLQFWIRRWFRTLPNYYLVLIVLVLCYYVVHKGPPPQLIRYFTFTQNFASAHPLFFGEAWSLPVEEWFYLLVPAGLFVLLRFTASREKALLWWILFVLMAGTFIRIFKVSQHDFLADDTFGGEIVKQVITRIDSIMYGLLGAWLSMYKPLQWQKHKNIIFAAGIMLIVFCNVYRSAFFVSYLYYSLLALGALCLLPKLSSIQSGKGGLYRAITFISVISYSMYLTNHMLVQRAILPKILSLAHFSEKSKMGNLVALILFWGFTLLLSYLLYRFWEKPWMRLRDRIRLK